MKKIIAGGILLFFSLTFLNCKGKGEEGLTDEEISGVSGTDEEGSSDIAPLEGAVKPLDGADLNLPPPAAPKIQMTITPVALTRETKTVFEFGADVADAKFECRLDGGLLPDCTSPLTLENLTDGQHLLEITAFNGEIKSEESAKFAWTVDTLAPIITLTKSPDPLVTADAVVFEFTSDDNGTIFSCYLDDFEDPFPCSSPFSLGGLEEGKHTVRITASDILGNESGTLETSFLVNLPPAAPRLLAMPRNRTNKQNGIFSWKAPCGSKFICKLDGAEVVCPVAPAKSSGGDFLADEARTTAGRGSAGMVAEKGGKGGSVERGSASGRNCTYTHEVAGPLAEGAHQFSITTLDEYGIASRDEKQNRYAWTVDLTPPDIETIMCSPGPSTLSPSPEGTVSCTFGEPVQAVKKDFFSLTWVSRGDKVAGQIDLRGRKATSQKFQTFTFKSTDPLSSFGNQYKATIESETIADLAGNKMAAKEWYYLAGEGLWNRMEAVLYQTPEDTTETITLGGPTPVSTTVPVTIRIPELDMDMNQSGQIAVLHPLKRARGFAKDYDLIAGVVTPDPGAEDIIVNGVPVWTGSWPIKIIKPKLFFRWGAWFEFWKDEVADGLDKYRLFSSIIGYGDERFGGDNILDYSADVNKNGDTLVVWNDMGSGEYGQLKFQLFTEGAWKRVRKIHSAVYPETICRAVLEDSGNGFAYWSNKDEEKNHLFVQRIGRNGVQQGNIHKLDNAASTMEVSDNFQIVVDPSERATAVWVQTLTDGAETQYTIWASQFDPITNQWTLPLGILRHDGGKPITNLRAVKNRHGDVLIAFIRGSGSEKELLSLEYNSFKNKWSDPKAIVNGNGNFRALEIGIDAMKNIVAVAVQKTGETRKLVSNRYYAGFGWGGVLTEIYSVRGPINSLKLATIENGQAAAVWSEGSANGREETVIKYIRFDPAVFHGAAGSLPPAELPPPAPEAPSSP